MGPASHPQRRTDIWALLYWCVLSPLHLVVLGCCCVVHAFPPPFGCVGLCVLSPLHLVVLGCCCVVRAFPLHLIVLGCCCVVRAFPPPFGCVGLCCACFLPLHLVVLGCCCFDLSVVWMWCNALRCVVFCVLCWILWEEMFTEKC